MSDSDITFLLILDACRRDYLTHENAPFLRGLMETGVTASIESPPGFTQRTTMFTGTYPDTSNAFSAFGYDPANSPFRWIFGVTVGVAVLAGFGADALDVWMKHVSFDASNTIEPQRK